jgi:hypothetical protein
LLIELRVAGLVLAAGIVAYAVVRYAQGRAGKTTLSLSLLVGGLLAIVAIEPQLVFLVRDLLGIEQVPLSGLVIVLIAAVVLEFLLIVGNSARIDETRLRMGQLVGALALTSLEVPPGRPRPGLVAVVPALNEAENLGVVLKRMPSEVHGLPVLVLVVDDGSSDETGEVARQHGAAVVTHPINLGGGAALRLGYQLAERLGASIVVTLDADGQHDPGEIQRVVDPILVGRADFVIGSRLKGHHEPASLIRHVGIYVFNALISLLARQTITDCSSGFRAIRAEALPRLHLAEDQFHSAESILDAIKGGLRVEEVPITVTRRLSGTTKKGPALRYGWGFLRAIVRTWWR